MLLTLSLVLLLVHFVTKKGGGKSVPNAWQSLVELIYDFVPNLEYFVYVIFFVVCFSAGDVATCDGVGGVEGPPSPPVVGIRVAPEVWELPPAAPEVWELPPAAPEVPVLAQQLIPDPQRESELYSRFLVNTIGENPTLRRITETISVQNEIERLIEAALVRSGFNPTRILENRHRIRGFVFYPRGRALSLRQYRSHLQSIYRLGTRDTRAFQRLMTAVRNYDLWL
ncbi:hypothetical protein TSUD_199250 [Trifolium subterraneum]|uniref:Uncharacterized protein n=1 Tax=Trifolium subterraneum TaxID=3900 RepID=A0A2Z6LN57_TRISU|nr:hypothetical protein TSUD_199250 [Trifolium subterraneum]